MPHLLHQGCQALLHLAHGEHHAGPVALVVEGDAYGQVAGRDGAGNGDGVLRLAAQLAGNVAGQPECDSGAHDDGNRGKSQAQLEHGVGAVGQFGLDLPGSLILFLQDVQQFRADLAPYGRFLGIQDANRSPAIALHQRNNAVLHRSTLLLQRFHLGQPGVGGGVGPCKRACILERRAERFAGSRQVPVAGFVVRRQDDVAQRLSRLQALGVQGIGLAQEGLVALDKAVEAAGRLAHAGNGHRQRNRK